MEIVYKNHSELFIQLLSESNESVTLVSPFIKSDMAESISKNLNDKIKLRILTKVDAEDFKKGASDINALGIFKEHFSNIEIKVCQELHAKVFIFDNIKAIITSANLTFSGINSNIEYGVMITEKEKISKINNDIDTLFDNADDFDSLKEVGTRVKPKNPKLSAEKIKKDLISIQKTTFQPQNKKADSEILKNRPIIHLATEYKYRKNLIDKLLLHSLEIKIGEKIEFHDNDSYNDNCQIIGSLSYIFDNKKGKYKKIEYLIDGKNIKETIDYLNVGEYVDTCFLSKNEWVNTSYEFDGFKKLKLNENKQWYACFKYRSGTPLFMPVKNHGPQTKFTILSMVNQVKYTLMEGELMYYYKGEIH